MPNYYEILGVANNASETDIKKAYRSLSLIHHPDRGGDATLFQEINNAYETLSDDQRRRIYDIELSGGGMGGPDGAHFGFAEDMNNIFNMMFGGGGFPGGFHGGGGGPGIHVFHGGPGGPGGMFFQNLQRPPPIIKQVKIQLQQAYTGVSLPIEIERWMMQGDIKINEIETIYIHIPAGADSNEMMIVRDKGHILNEQSKGDVKIVIMVENTTEFRREGLDLIYKKSVSLKEALCGFTFDINHINGKTLTINNYSNKSIISPGFKKPLANMGMTRDGNTGKLVIDFDIEFPQTLSEEQVAKLREIL